jgi:hypothetical protein
MLVTTFIIQQQAALKNIQIAKFMDYKDSDEPIRVSPPISLTPINIVWVEYF